MPKKDRAFSLCVRETPEEVCRILQDASASGFPIVTTALFYGKVGPESFRLSRRLRFWAGFPNPHVCGTVCRHEDGTHIDVVVKLKKSDVLTLPFYVFVLLIAAVALLLEWSGNSNAELLFPFLVLIALGMPLFLLPYTLNRYARKAKAELLALFDSRYRFVIEKK